MGIVVKADTNEAVQVPDKEAAAGLKSGIYHLPLVDKDGALSSSPLENAQELIKQGSHVEPNMDQLQSMLSHSEHSTPLQQLGALGEGIAEQATFGASVPFERALGIKKEDINARREANPITHTIGQGIGVVLPAAVGLGELSPIAALGEGAESIASSAGLGETLSGAARMAGEGAAFQGVDELSKMFADDPHQTMQTAAANIGLTGLLAPVIGSALSGLSSIAGKQADNLAHVMGSLKGRVADVTPLTAEELGARLGAADAAPASAETISSDLSAMEPQAEEAVPDGIKSSILKMLGKMPRKLLRYGAYAKLGPLGGLAADMVSDSLGRKVSEDIAAPMLERFMNNSDSRVIPEALNAMINTAQAAQRGLDLVNKTVRNVVAGKAGEISGLSDFEVRRLEKAAEIYQNDPMQFMKAGEHLSAYEPGHADAMASLFNNTMIAVNAAKPKDQATGILDTATKPSKMETAQYFRKLQTIQNPLSVVQRIPHGTVTSEDIALLKSVYPDLHRLINEKMTNQLIEAKSKGRLPDYKTRLGLSQFMGMPLDSTMQPAAIMMNQSRMTGMAQDQQQQNQPHQGRALKSLAKLPGMYMTADSAKEAKRALK